MYVCKILPVVLWACFACYGYVHAQDLEAKSALYFENSTGTIWTEAEYQRRLQNQIEALKKIKKEVHVEENRSEPFFRNDSAIVSFRWEFFLGSAKQFEKNTAARAQFESLKGSPFPFDKMASAAQWAPGKPTLINLWFTACAPCIAEMPVLNMLKEKYGDQVQFLSILPESADKLRAFLEKHAFYFSHHPGERKFLETIRAISFPKNVILDDQGVVVALHGGLPMKKDSEGSLEDAQELMEVLDALLVQQNK